jgi:hypothetical protein
MSSTLTPERVATGATELRRGSFQLILDGKPAGSIDRNQTVELQVQPGPHTLQVKAGRYSSHAQCATGAGKRHSDIEAACADYRAAGVAGTAVAVTDFPHRRQKEECRTPRDPSARKLATECALSLASLADGVGPYLLSRSNPWVGRG